MSNYFRTDGWVKSSLGPAIPGAQIWVCTQPANIASLPPSPLAAVFSDPNGLVPISLPILTDGFGHYDFYTTVGVYTVIVGLGGIVQAVYPDQSVGGGTQGGGTALTLSINGAPASSQTVQNLTGAGSVSVVDAGAGTVTITGATTSLQTNGTPNTLQSTLNLKNGANITLTPDALGGVTVAASGGAIGTGGVFAGVGILNPGNQASYAALGADGTFQFYQFILPIALTVSKVTADVYNAFAPTAKVSFGLYNTSGALVLDSGAFTVTGSSGTFQTKSITPVSLPVGVYFLVIGNVDHNTNTPTTTGATLFSTLWNGNTAKRTGTMAGVYAGAALPPTMGVLTLSDAVNTPPLPLFEQ